MICILDIKPWYEIGANVATMISAIAIVFVIFEYTANRNIRNIQLMQRCIDIFREWFQKPQAKVDITYLEILNEELFYFQQKLIPKKVAVEWIEGILDYIIVYDNEKNPLNHYASQVEINELDTWNDKRYFYHRINFFTYTTLPATYAVPDLEENAHSWKKRRLALELYRHIKTYRY